MSSDRQLFDLESLTFVSGERYLGPLGNEQEQLLGLTLISVTLLAC